MPRIRSLKPDALQHRKVGSLSDRAFRVWVGMLTQADDEGRLVSDPEQLRVLFFGYHRNVTAEDVQIALDEIAKSGLIRLYLVRGVTYADFPSWRDHQRIDRATRSKLPSYEEFVSTKTRRRLGERSTRARGGSEGSGREGRGKDGGESEGRVPGDASPGPPLDVIADENRKQQSNSHHRRPATGEYQEILSRVKTTRPELSEQEAGSLALRLFEETLRS